MPKFTDEQMLEICRVRERLLSHKNKLQPYPAKPADIDNKLNDLPAQPGSIPRWEHEQMKQLKSQVLHLQGKVNKLLEVKKIKETKKQPTGSGEFVDVTDRYMR